MCAAATKVGTAAGGLHDPPVPPPPQTAPLQQLAAVLADMARNGELYKQHEFGTIYLKYTERLVDGKWIVDTESVVYGGS